MIDISPAVEAFRPKSGLRGARRFGYFVAVVVNAMMLWAAHNLLDWRWPSFLTDSFEDLLPIVSASLLVTVAVYIVFWVNDSRPVKALGELLMAAFGVAVALRSWQVFPFDFGAYEYDWSWVARAVIVLAIVGSGIGILVALGRLFRSDPERENL